MKKWIKKMGAWRSLVPAVVLAVCVQISLSGYTAPVFEVQEPTETVTEDPETETESSIADTETETESETAAEETEGTSSYKDGTYYGTADGYRGSITVAVTVENGKITAISVQESSDDAVFFDKAKTLLDTIVQKQSTQVDVVSGATYSSAGLINAVRNALKEAGMETDTASISVPAASAQSPATGATTETEEANDPEKYKNGTYYGTGTGFGGTIKVKVVIKKGKIKKITVVESSDDATYLEKAKTLLARIIRKQSTDVDTVSGATYSSTGLINAVRDALKDAAKTTTTTSKKKKSTKKQTETEAGTETETETGNSVSVTTGTLPYKDGVYYGTGEGYRGDITVAVTISDKAIQDIQITAAEDDPAFLEKAKAILEQVKANQGTDVDVVSGATFSSRGILEAIDNALLEAKRLSEEGQTETESTEAKETETQKETENTTEGSTESSETGSQAIANGTYAVEAVCEPGAEGGFDAYTLSASVTIKDGKVTAVTDICGTGDYYDSDNDWFISRAANGTSKYPGVVAQITETGTAENIDAVSGATCSSNAIIAAVKQALEMAGAEAQK